MYLLLYSPSCLIFIFTNKIHVYFKCCDRYICIIVAFIFTCISNFLFRNENFLLNLFLRNINYIDTCSFVLDLNTHNCVFSFLLVVNTSTHNFIWILLWILLLNIHTWIFSFCFNGYNHTFLFRVHTCVFILGLNSYSYILIYLC